MKTSKKITFPTLDNEFLENILRQLVHQQSIVQIFFAQNTPPVISHLIIHLENNNEVQKLQVSNWVQNVRKRYQVNISFIYTTKLKHHLSLGHPFFQFCCQPSALIYQDDKSDISPINIINWKQYKKNFHAFEERFYHDHDLQMSQVSNLIAESASNSVFTLFARLIEYDIDYLEELYTGRNFADLSLDDRINNLIQYIPEIQKIFVKINTNTYFLTTLFTKAKEATADDEALYKNEMYESVRGAEQSLYLLIAKRFDDLKRLIKKEALKLQKTPKQIDRKPEDLILVEAIHTIQNLVETEQIYLYHHITYGEKTTYYLMLIAQGAGNEKLRMIGQSLKSKMSGEYDFVLIGHSRYWIQKNLYQHQSFFTKIIQDKYLVYTTSPYHPELHWETDHQPYHADLYFYYKSTKHSAVQFLEICSNGTENYQGLEYLFSMFFISFCRTYIFLKTYYVPNYLSTQSLWQLCAYGDNDIHKYQYLIEQFWTDFFPYLDKHLTIQHELSQLDKQKVGQMNTIIVKLMDELHNLVIKGGLLNLNDDYIVYKTHN